MIVIVKGNRHQAMIAASNRAIPFAVVSVTDHETAGRVPDVCRARSPRGSARPAKPRSRSARVSSTGARTPHERGRPSLSLPPLRDGLLRCRSPAHRGRAADAAGPRSAGSPAHRAAGGRSRWSGASAVRRGAGGGRTMTTSGRRWTARREREAMTAHVSRCRFCRALLAHSRRRDDRELLLAAELLAEEHAANDGEREDFGQRVAKRLATTTTTRHDRRSIRRSREERLQQPGPAPRCSPASAGMRSRR